MATGDKKKLIKISVRDFAQPVPRYGSIDSHSGFGASTQDGLEIHQDVQARRAEAHDNYEREVYLCDEFSVDAYIFQVSGRLDGLFTGETHLIEEIKSAFSTGELAERLKKEPFHPYVLQLQTYAYLYHRLHGLQANLRFLLVDTRQRQETLVSIPFVIAEYEVWLARRLAALATEEKERERRRKRRQKAAAKLVFPFPRPRPGQTELIATIERIFADQKHAMIQAPTGLGKTLGVMFPSFQNALSRGAQTLYVTPKNSQHALATEAVRKFQEQGAKVNALVLTAKSKSCLKPEPLCQERYCEFAADYYTKVAEHDLLRKLEKEPILDAAVFRDYGLRYQVCPFQLSVEMAERMDTVVCDYNYVFSPNGTLSHLSQDKEAHEAPNLVVDEAHNLPQRAMDYFSPVFSEAYLESMAERVQALPDPFAEEGEKLLEDCVNAIRRYRPATSEPHTVVELKPFAFQRLAEKTLEFQGRYLSSDVVIGENDVVLELVRYTTQFCEQTLLSGEEFFTTYRQLPSGDSLKITCCDASVALAEKIALYHRVVAFSATLKPFEYYLRLSGFNTRSTETAEFFSPFPRDNRKILVIPQVSTKYRERDKNYRKIADAISRIIALRPGNYFAFFPSFDFLEKTCGLLQVPGFTLYAQERDMPKAEAEAILTALQSPGGRHLVLGVQGGTFAEGIDYPGDQLIGCFVIGPALPNYNVERNLMARYYDTHYGEGFNFAYTYPAMAKVVQAAGRVIRSETDQGLIVLMDERFTEKTYTRTMPQDWYDSHVGELVSTRILDDVHRFWCQTQASSISAAETDIAAPQASSQGDQYEPSI